MDSVYWAQKAGNRRCCSMKLRVVVLSAHLLQPLNDRPAKARFSHRIARISREFLG